ncbi:MAG: mannose-1-phosphate guanylyltransferase/mannose-6-phosphate isomerase [Betaproteobacteria bacterium]|nr:mannose-1-phosphate guanylyltransferase/mannose-6-phosphate isomerase [Betaproteobacteria bacterium]
MSIRVVPIVLCGGSGSRLWPLSRLALPKQFLPLVSERSMLQDTVTRLAGLPQVQAPVVVCSTEHRFLVAEQLREIGVAPRAIVLEPAGRNTAPAVAAALLALGDDARDAVALVLPSDHRIGDIARFHAAIDAALEAARAARLVTFGVLPDSPHTGYGYIRRAAATGKAAVQPVAEFVEKPTLARAQEFLASGDYLWNSGIFVFRADTYLAELGAQRPAILAAVEQAVALGARDLDFLRLDEAAFAACPADSIDYAVMEHTRSASVVTADFQWSDVGSWSALWDIGAKDALGNVSRGDVYLDQASNSYVRAESRLVAAVGVKDLLIVETDDAVLVAHKDHAQDVKQAVEHLKAQQREEHISHRRVYRPWGYYEGLDEGAGFQVKRLMVKPGAKISLQLHRRRAEHWVVVSGRAKVTRDAEEILLGPNQSTYIPLGMRHRLENVGAEPLFVIEVQSGDYLGEDDIERFADDYRRN